MKITQWFQYLGNHHPLVNEGWENDEELWKNMHSSFSIIYSREKSVHCKKKKKKKVNYTDALTWSCTIDKPLLRCMYTNKENKMWMHVNKEDNKI